MQAYVLIQTQPRSHPVAGDLRALPDIVSADEVTGAYDVIALARSASMRHLTEVVLAEIRRIPGVVRALPAPLRDHGDDDGRTGSTLERSLAGVGAA